MRGLQATRGTALNDSVNPGDPAAAQRPRRIRLLLIIAACVLIADLVSKTVVVATLSDRAPIRLLGGLLTLRVLRNSGAAFSIGTSMTFVFSVIAVGVIIAILRTARRLRSIPWAITLGLLLGGAAGNLGDRIFRSPGPFRGHVVDWIQLPHWPVFNVADSCIVCGGVLAVLLAARGVSLEGGRQQATQAPSSQPPGGAALAISLPAPGQPAPGQPVTGQPVTGQPVTSQPAARRPGAGQRDAGSAGPAAYPGGPGPRGPAEDGSR